MKTEEIVKYAALAFGGYMLYIWLRDNCYLAQFGMAGSSGCYQTASGWQMGAPPVATGVSAPPAQTTTAPGTQQAVGQPPTNTAPPATTYVQPTPQPVTPSQTQIQNSASLGDASAIALSDQAGLRYTADQWNFIRHSADPSQPLTETDLFPVGNRGYMMSASEYINARHSANLSGLHGAYHMMRGMGWTQ